MIELKYLVLAVVVIYIPFHLFEEAIGNFPESMYQHKWIPERITHGHWMATNIFFYFPLLVLGYSLYLISPNLLPFGLGILFWGIINLRDHLFYTFIDRKLSPGIFTGLLFGVVSIFAIISYSTDFSFSVTALSVFLGIAYSFLPVMFSIVAHKLFKKILV